MNVRRGSLSAMPLASSKRAPWLNILPDKEYKSMLGRLHDEIVAYVGYMTPTLEEETVVTDVGKCVRAVLEKPFRKCQVHTSGSTASGLRLPESDIDLVIETTDFVTPKYELSKIASILRGKRWCGSVEEILEARVPIIKFSTTPGFGSLKFDVGINGTGGLKNGAWVKERLKAMPALRPLVLLIKGALSQCNLNDASQHSLSSFAVICMCVFILDLNPYEFPEEYFTDPMRSKSLGAILFAFLVYYSEDLPYKTKYISVSQGCLESKTWASWIHYRCAGNLVIQCPNDPRRNITASLSLQNFNEIQRVFTQAHKDIRKSRASSRNILGALVLVDTEYIERRKRTEQLVKSGHLQKNLRGEVSSLTESRALRAPWIPPVRTGVPGSSRRGVEFQQTDELQLESEKLLSELRSLSLSNRTSTVASQPKSTNRALGREAPSSRWM